jgi:hypothetical protein
MGYGVKPRVFDMLEMIFTIAKIAGIEKWSVQKVLNFGFFGNFAIFWQSIETTHA